MQKSTEKVKSLTKELQAENEKLTDVTIKTNNLSRRFQRLALSYQTATPTSFPKLQERREALGEEVTQNNLEGQRIRSKTDRLKIEIDEELKVMDESREICP